MSTIYLYEITYIANIFQFIYFLHSSSFVLQYKKNIDFSILPYRTNKNIEIFVKVSTCQLNLMLYL